MASVPVISQLSQALSFLKEHPKLSCVLLLFLSPPIYRILLYFTPLLLSTALCIFALITLTPYVTATDAEVERQSMLGATSQVHLKTKTNTSTAATFGTLGKERKLETASGHGKPSSSSSSLSASSAAAFSASASASVLTASSSSSDGEASWFSWMKGLNDIGRTWMENKLIEQGLALSEPANRETLLAFIEGSFADLLTVQETPSTEIFAAIDDHERAVAAAEATHVESEHSAAEKIVEAMKVSTVECVSEAYEKQKNIKEEKIVCAQAGFCGVVEGASIENVTDEDTVREVENEAARGMSDIRAAAFKEPECASNYSVKSIQGNSEPILDKDVKVRKQKPHVAYESSLPMMDSISDAQPAPAYSLPKTPSRIPAPSKLLEASRRIFSKEEQSSRTLLPRAPLQASSAAKVNQPFKASFGNTQSKLESPMNVFKLPTRKLLERSRSIPDKEGSKPSSTSTLEAHAGHKGMQGETRESNAVNDGEGVADVCLSDAGNFSLGACDDGPRFDEDLKVEEAQALVQSELRMLEVELEEVAAKLPKLDETFAYQKTPIKSPSMPHTPISTPIKCNTGLFTTSSGFKTS